MGEFRLDPFVERLGRVVLIRLINRAINSLEWTKTTADRLIFIANRLKSPIGANDELKLYISGQGINHFMQFIQSNPEFHVEDMLATPEFGWDIISAAKDPKREKATGKDLDFYQNTYAIPKGFITSYDLISYLDIPAEEAKKYICKCYKFDCEYAKRGRFCYYSRTDVPFEEVIENMSHAESGEVLSGRSDLTMEHIRRFPQVRWNWYTASLQKGISLEEIIGHEDMGMTFRNIFVSNMISRKEGITLQDVENHPEVNWVGLYEPVTKEFFERNLHIEYNYTGLAEKEWMTFDYVKSRPDIPWPKNFYCMLKGVTWDDLPEIKKMGGIAMYRFFSNPNAVERDLCRKILRKDWLRPFLSAFIMSPSTIGPFLNDLAIIVADYM